MYKRGDYGCRIGNVTTDAGRDAERRTWVQQERGLKVEGADGRRESGHSPATRQQESLSSAVLFARITSFVISSVPAMDILKAEIERKRKLLKDQSLVGEGKKFFKREELIRKEEEEYWSQQRANQPHLSADPLPHNQPTPSSSSSTEGSASVSKPDGSTATADKILNRKEVIKRLRERSEPILLFGESETDSFKRLRQLEIREPELNRGLRNDFQEAMDKVDQAYLTEVLKSGARGETSDKTKANDVKVQSSDTDIDKINELAKDLGRHVASYKDDVRNEHKRHDAEVIHSFLRFMLELWGTKLNKRSEEEKTSMKGKIASATYTQTQSYLRPLFKQLKSAKIGADILRHLVSIVRLLLEREYIKANDCYLQMAIGNAPWPIGVTMVGIHARTGREKIFAQNIAHVLNDETQRKYIQGLKRLMTQAQYFFPTDPSKCVEYNALDH